jgi:putative oxidoreductase
LLGLYLAAASTVLACGPGLFSIDELIARLVEPNLEINASTESFDEPVVALTEASATR